MSHKTKGSPDIFKPCYPPPERPKQDVVDTGRPGKGVHGRHRTNLQALAKENSLDAMQKLIELMSDTNPCVRFGAVRLLLKFCNGNGSMTHKHGSAASPSTEGVLKVTIARFKEEEKKSGTTKRHRTLPVVQRGREGSWDPGDGDGAGVHTLRGQRPGVCDES